MLRDDFTLTKQHLGWLLTTAGALGFAAVFSIDLLAIVRQSGVSGLFSAEAIDYLHSPLGIGPAQRLALAVCIGVTLIGLTLIPLGKRPA